MPPGAERPHLPRAGPCAQWPHPRRAGQAQDAPHAHLRPCAEPVAGAEGQWPGSHIQAGGCVLGHTTSPTYNGGETATSTEQRSHTKASGRTVQADTVHTCANSHKLTSRCGVTSLHTPAHDRCPCAQEHGETHAHIETPAPVCAPTHSLAGKTSAPQTHTHGQVSKGGPHWIQECTHIEHTRIHPFVYTATPHTPARYTRATQISMYTATLTHRAHRSLLSFLSLCKVNSFNPRARPRHGTKPLLVRAGFRGGRLCLPPFYR